MKLKIMILAAIAALAASGCATTGTTGGGLGGLFGSSAPQVDENGNEIAPQRTRRQEGTRGFLRGCGMGALVGVLSRSPEAALAGCAVAGVAEARVSVAKYDAQVERARNFQKGTVSVGVVSRVETTPVSVETKQADGSVKVEQTERLDRLYVPMKAERVDAKDPKLADVLRRLGRLAAEDDSGLPMTITVEGPDGKRAWVRGQIEQALAGASNVQVGEKTATAYAVEVSPIPSNNGK